MKILKILKDRMKQADNDDPNASSWGYQEGVLLSLNEANELLELLAKLPGPPPKDGKRYVAKHPIWETFMGVRWEQEWVWDEKRFGSYEPTAYLSFSLDDLE